MAWGHADDEDYRVNIPERITVSRPVAMEIQSDVRFPDEPSPIPKTLYLLLGVVPLVLVAIVLFARTGVIDMSGNGNTRTPWDLSIILLSLIVIFVMAALVGRRAPELHRRSRAEAFDAALAKQEWLTTFVSLPLAGIVAVIAALAWARVMTHVGPVELSPMAPPILGGVAILLTSAPLAYFTWARTRRMAELEDRFPDFLRDLNESHSAGMTMVQAVEVASRGDYGKLNPEIRRMAHQLSWGASFTDALRLFSERVGTPLLTRTTALIIKATQAGGNVRDVLHAAAADARDIKALEADRRMNMMLYTIIIYVAFGVFLAVTAALQGLLIPAILSSTQGIQGGNLGGITLGNDLTLADFHYIYFAIALIQAFGSGIVAGAMSEGTIAGGLKHSVILVLMAIVVLGIF